MQHRNSIAYEISKGVEVSFVLISARSKTCVSIFAAQHYT